MMWLSCRWMIFSGGYRPSRRRRLVCHRLLQTLALIFITWSTLDVLRIHRRLSQTHADYHLYKPPKRPERIYIASTHWNNENILRSHWNEAVVDLARALGPENVYISVVESGSWDGTKNALAELDAALGRLGVPKSIVFSNTTHHDEISVAPAEDGWIMTPRKRKELRRIPYLARVRNWSLQPLKALTDDGVIFDRILFLNDVVFTANDVLNLLNTNNGEYAAACALDFSRPPYYYDTFALRDSNGQEHLMQTWPFFRSAESRNAMEAMKPVPVASCWNGMVSMSASPFLSDPPLRFRGVPDSLALAHVEGSECCLIHADNPLSNQKGVYMNPNVRVGYSGPAYAKVHPDHSWVSCWQILWGLWENRFRRWTTTPLIKEWMIWRRVANWKAQMDGHNETGGYCLVNEMQVLTANGWAHM